MLAEMTDAAETLGHITVDVRTGEVRRDGAPVRISNREREVIVALALHRRAVGMDRLGDLLFPDCAARDARNNLKVTVYRLRRRISHAFIVHDGECYRFGSRVALNCEDPAAVMLGLTRCAQPPQPSRFDELAALARFLRLEPSSGLLRCDWYADIWQTYSRQGRDIALNLAARALATGDAQRAIELAGELTCEDRCDEEAWEIIVEAHLKCGRRGAATRAYEIYRAAVESELGTAPSQPMTHLLAQAV